MEEELFQFNPWWQEEYSAPGIKREALSRMVEESTRKEITLLTGLRRVGKTVLLHQTIGELIKKMSPKRILFVSLEHPKFTKAGILEIVRTFRKIHGHTRETPLYLFFDEVMYLDGFEKELKILHDHEKVKVFASGSSAGLLRDSGAHLTGRNRIVMLDPLTFGEFLSFNKIAVKQGEEYLFEKHFEEYMKIGGMPEYVLSKDPEKITSLIKDILIKDIVGKYLIRDLKTLEELFVLLCERVGKMETYNRLANILNVKPDTIKSYMSYLEESYLFFQISRSSHSLNERIRSPKKIYIGDIGIRNVYSGFRDLGAIYENLVFLKIRKDNPSYYYADKTEIDFVFGDTMIEAKYGSKMNENQEKEFKNAKYKHKQIAQGYRFFI